MDETEKTPIVNRISVVALIIGLIVGFGLGSIDWDNDDVVGMSQTGETSGTVDENTTHTADRSTGTFITVADQKAGSVAIIENVYAPAKGWVAVREEKGNILGAQRLVKDLNENVRVNLLRNTVPSADYRVIIYTDDGDNLFNHKVDTLWEIDGKVVEQMFRTL